MPADKRDSDGKVAKALKTAEGTDPRGEFFPILLTLEQLHTQNFIARV